MNEEILKNIINNYNTPAYVFDIETLRKRIKYLKEKLPKRLTLCYAIKANTFIIKDIEEDIDRFEVCSPGEYQICKEKEIAQSKILISGVYKTPEVIKEMINTTPDIECYSIESMEQYELFKNIKTKNKIRLLIRLTSGNQFGITENEVEKIINERSKYSNLEIKGIQYFSGTQKLSLKNIEKEIKYIDEFIKKLYEQYGYEIEELEYGGGFPVQYFQNSEFDEENYLKEFSRIIEQMNYNGKLILELRKKYSS